MIRNVLAYLEEAAQSAPGRVAIDAPGSSFTWGELGRRARQIGSRLAQLTPAQSPVLILMEKSPECVAAMLGTVYAGCFYTPLDPGMPQKRMKLIAQVLRPAVILTSTSLQDTARNLCDGVPVCVYETIAPQIHDQELDRRREEQIDTDLLYVLFTSGSTGIPKGVAICHRSVIDFIEWACEALRLPDGVRFASQAPFYFDNSVLDLYGAMRKRGSVYLIPRENFAFPKKLIQTLISEHIDTIFWVPSALSQAASSGLLTPGLMPDLKRIFFCGEVMPARTLSAWKAAVPDADYVNMYGPTEITDVCTWYRIDRDFGPEESLPIGKPCANTRIYLINGEICVAGTCLSRGYYADPERTAACFVQNPLRPQIQERIYRTGDLARYNEQGQLIFLGRCDSQIKRNGYRIELGEIESVLSASEGVQLSCCWYGTESERITAAYTGDAEEKAVKKYLKNSLPRYMMPDRIIRLETMPRTGSGKIDRQALREENGA